MLAHLLEAVAPSRDTRYSEVRPAGRLDGLIDELSGLRFTLILTARWEASSKDDWGRWEELRARLATLRRQYADKIDEIAMTISVPDAIRAQEYVERSVAVPGGLRLPMESWEEEIDPGI
jgi:hypothetical protein